MVPLYWYTNTNNSTFENHEQITLNNKMAASASQQPQKFQYILQLYFHQKYHLVNIFFRVFSMHAFLFCSASLTSKCMHFNLRLQCQIITCFATCNLFMNVENSG